MNTKKYYNMIKTLTVLISILILSNCSSAIDTSDSSENTSSDLIGGVIVGNPTKPKVQNLIQIFPNIKKIIPSNINFLNEQNNVNRVKKKESKETETSTDVSQKTTKNKKNPSNNNENETKGQLNKNQIILQDSIKNFATDIQISQTIFDNLQQINLIVKDYLEDSDVVFEFDENNQFVIKNIEFDILRRSNRYELTIQKSEDVENLFYFFFKNLDYDDYTVTYISQYDEKGKPIIGSLHFVNPLLIHDVKKLPTLASDGKPVLRYLNLSFDFSDQNKSLLHLKQELYNKVWRAKDMRYYCAVRNKETLCEGQYSFIASTPVEERTIAPGSIVYTWSAKRPYDNCFGFFDFDTSERIIKKKFKVKNFSTNTSYDDFIFSNCFIGAYFMNFSPLLTPEDFILRYNDTDPLGGTASIIFNEDHNIADFEYLELFDDTNF